MKLIVKKKDFKYPNSVVNTFEEEYNIYLTKCKKKMHRTREMFSLCFDSTLSDLQKSVFVYTDEETAEKIKQKYEVIEEVEDSIY